MEVITLDKLKAGEKPFSAWGYSRLKVTRSVPKDNGEEGTEMKEYELRVPIKSIGVVDAMQQFAKQNMPNPPSSMKTIRKDSDEGRSLGLKHDRIVEVVDETDQSYRDAMAQYEQNGTYKVMLTGLNMDVVDEDGTVLVNPNGLEKKTEVRNEMRTIEVLKETGLSAGHMMKLAKDINNLTEIDEGKADLE